MGDARSEAAGGGTRADFDAVIVGAGFAGLYMLHRLRGLGFRAVVLEMADDVGGTWYWNRYPGARCDIESLDYSYSFSEDLQQEWVWSERYATQPEILRYCAHVAERFDLRRDIRFNTRVTGAHWDDAASAWRVLTESGDTLIARHCVMATGCLSTTQTPDFPGLADFAGPVYHTGQWPHDGVDFTGRRVAIIGTGSSAIQSIPLIAAQAAHLYVFQRTPNFSIPARNGPIDPDYERRVKANYAAFRQEARESRSGFVSDRQDISALAVSAEAREAAYETRWQRGGLGFSGAFNDLLVNPDANATAADFFHRKIRGIVRDPGVADTLCPRNHPIGTKRMCVDTDYYATFNRDNVTLVNLRTDPLIGITPAGVRTESAEWPVDSLITATGFDAMTGTLMRLDLRGRPGQTIQKAWADGPSAYLGLMMTGFPNLYLITGPGSPSVLSNMMVSIEQHVDWVADCLDYLREHDLATIEPTPEAEARWLAHVREVGDSTLYPRANSWYMGANVAGKPRVFMPYVGGVGAYRQLCATIAAEGYSGFTLGRAASAVPAPAPADA